METANVPSNEIARLKALMDLAILDSAPEPVFDAIVKSVAAALGVPIALVSLVDETRQWFKARVGLDATQTPRDVAFCAHAILEPRSLAITDSEADPRFVDNPLVTGAPHVRSYLGAPLVTAEGHAFGTLCAIDHVPRQWTKTEIQQLETLASVVTELLTQRRAVLNADRLANDVVALSEELVRGQRLMEGVSSAANVGGWSLDLETSELTWTDQTRRIHEVGDDFDVDLDKAIGFYAPEAQDDVRAAVEASMLTGQNWTLDLPLTTAKGNRLWVRSMGKAEIFEGRPIRLYGAFQDITAERTRQIALTEAVACADRALADVAAYQAALDKHAIVAVTDARGDILFVNDRFSEISGYSREELIGNNHRILNSGHHSKAFFVDLWRTIGRGQSWHGEVCNRTKTGELYWVDTTIVPMIGIDGRPERFVSLRYDITARKEADAALAVALQTAEAGTVAKSAFLANMSHEIRTPLNGVIGLAEALSMTTLDPRQSEMVTLIKSSGQTLERLLSDILDMSKIEAGKLDLHIQPFDLKEAVDTAAQIMRVRADDKGIGFDVIYGPNARGLFDGDVVRVRQIVSNLASNAVKFTNVGGVRIMIDVADHETGPAQMTIAVEDTGIGFDEEAGRRLFSRFEQADGSITRNFGGTGLGLSICLSLADIMGGSITATSTPGVGSRFEVILKLERSISLTDFDLRGSECLAELADERDTDVDRHGDLRVLLVEDNLTNQRVVSLILEPFGISLVIANNGKEGVEAFSTGVFDAVLMDMQMPIMDGLSATRAIRAFERAHGRARTPIAMLSANAMSEHVDQSIAAGCDTHIAKPVTPDRLIKGLQLALSLCASEIEDNVQDELQASAHGG